MVFELFTGGELVVNRWILGKIADIWNDSFPVRNRLASHVPTPVRWLRERRQHPNRGGLASTVRAEETIDRATWYGEIEAGNGCSVSVLFRECVRTDRECVVHWL